MILDSVKNALSSGTTLENLQQKSKEVLSIFDKARTGLAEINSKVSEEQAKRQEIVDKATKEIEELEQVYKQNSKVIQNINNIIS